MSDSRILMKRASEALKIAAIQLSEVERENSELKMKLASSELIIMAKERSGRAEDLAKLMLKKGMIKSSELNNKIDQIMKMDDDAFNAVKETVEAADSDSGTSAYVGDDEAIPEPEKKTSLERTEEVLRKTAATL